MHPEAATANIPGVTGRESDALWYKDAIIYQVHVRSFADSNNDGVGDFPGLTSRLDYIQSLGVTAIWLLPFFPSPLRDGGYDIADYRNVNPEYGTLKDFRQFLKEAHRRGLRVITELVMNHTSDQHEWFQKSRRAKPGSKWREYYVWSDTPERYREARIIFQDFESSNWTWDPVAEAYFWHRFYHHQPDLNFDNPEVRQAMIRVLDFWLDMGVDGLRLDAIPYLFEREGTNCENLPETHQFLKEVRAHIDKKYSDKMLLAEANQWPEDAAQYFGDGDECHMNFHFPLMPRLFMSVEREDRFPIVDILDQTPELPENCQWAIFLRNHDELTLEMVTDEERDYMYRAYAMDPKARVNLGIRRRLAPLLQNNRRKIELLNGLLLTLPGTPILYYGDEIGMGDNIYLGDRDGVRTPMQWSADRNAGFSNANPQKLFLPVIIDPEYHYALRNVELQHNSPHSLLWWMRRIINLRLQFNAFGRGSFEMLTPDNSKVLAYLREYDGQTLLVVANLSRYTQAVSLDLGRFRGQVPIELFGQSQFPAIGELPYLLTLGPYGFYWFQLKWLAREFVEATPDELPTCRLSGALDSLFQGRAKRSLEQALKPYLRRHRWFAGKARKIRHVELLDYFPIGPNGNAPIRLLLVRVDYLEGEPDMYLVPVIFAPSEQAANILGDHPAAGILCIETGDAKDARTLCEATWEAAFWESMLEAISERRSIRGQKGGISAVHTKAFRRVFTGVGGRPPHVHGGEQSNTSAIFDDQVILKLFRRVHPGINPDFEVGRHLTERVPTPHVPAVAGALEYRRENSEPMSLAILHEFIANSGDAWVYTLDELGRYIERVQSEQTLEPQELEQLLAAASPEASLDFVTLAAETPPPIAYKLIGGYLESAELLGKRTAELHLALAAEQEDPAFAPQPFSKLYQRSLYQSMRSLARRSIELLRRQLDELPEETVPLAERVLALENKVLSSYQDLLKRKISASRIRCHGDYHLGQVLYTGKDFVIIDFEGEPERALGERRIKTSPMRDVAGMIRSLHYASHAARLKETPGLTRTQESPLTLTQWLQFWYTWSAAVFVRSYLAEAQQGAILPQEDEEWGILLRAYVLDKAFYELQYELNNRPHWAPIPLEGILSLISGPRA